MKPYSLDELNKRLDRVNSWVNNCDQKSGILLAFVGVLFSFLMTSNVIIGGYEYLVEPFYEYWLGDVDAYISIKRILVFILLIPIVCCTFKMVYFLLKVLQAKIDIEEVSEENSQITKKSLLHFHSIAKMEYNSFLSSCKDQNEDSYLKDLCSQIYCNSKICTDKFENYKKGLKYFSRTLSFCFIELLIIFLFPQI